ncbi:MAG: class I SAM-dependent methyltransferase [Candidatus Lokiarchaeota archaeon]
MIIENVYDKIQNNVLRNSIKYLVNIFIPFPLIDNLPSDISEFLNIDKVKFLNLLKNKRYKEIFKGYRKNYKNWLKNSDYYFYDLCRWHQERKIKFFFEYFFPFSEFYPKGLDLLDFGSGIGTNSLIYAKRNNVFLVEINEKLLNFSKWRFKKYKRKGHFYSEIPQNKKFDMIILIDVIGHLLEPNKIITKLCASLKPEGILRVTFDNFQKSTDLKLHRNFEIDFHKTFIENGLTQLNKNHYQKRKFIK